MKLPAVWQISAQSIRSFTCSGLACSPPSVRQCVTVSQQVALQSAVASMALLSWRGRAWVLLRVGFFDALSDRESVVLGKRLSVRVDPGGRRIIKKKKYK